MFNYYTVQIFYETIQIFCQQCTGVRWDVKTAAIKVHSVPSSRSFIMHPHAIARRVLNDSRPRDGAAVRRRAMSFNGSNSTNFSGIGDYDNYTDIYTVEEIIEHITYTINFYYTPILIVLGTIGNLMSVYVFYNTKLRMQSTSQYLSALAISDTLFLFQLLPPWLHALRVTSVFHQQGFCQVFVYLTYVACCMSSWLVVAFTGERFVAVLYPLQRNAVCTVTRARHIIAGVVLASLVINLPVLRFAIPTNNDCNIDYDYIAYAATFNLIDAVLSFSIPLVVIVIMNVWIVFGVWRLERDRHLLMKAEHVTVRGGQPSTSTGQSTPVGRLRPSRILSCPRSQQRVTRMLLIVSSVFVCLNLPAYTMRLIAYAYGVVSYV